MQRPSITNTAIDDVLNRSVSEILPSKDSFRDLLVSGKKLKIYVGADATGPQLHLGHSTNFILLEKLRRLGHEVVILFGDFTAMLGDPTDKAAARIQLTKEQVEAHVTTWKSQVEKILNFHDSENPAKIVRNSEWLAPLTLADMIQLASHFTVQKMLERDMFEKRIQEEKPIYLHEFLYPLLQGYDSVVLDADVEIGGTDQTFNMLAGRTLQKKYHNKEKFVIATTLLEDPATGKKLMSKSEGGFVALNDPPNEMFGKIMALSDGVIIQLFIDCTLVPLSEIAEMSEGIALGELNPRDAKIRLAKEIVRMYHDEVAATEAEQYFVNTFSKHLLPENIKELSVIVGEELVGVLAANGLATSKTDARRKIEQGGVSIAGERITDEHATVQTKDLGQVLKVGKKDFRRLIGQ
jgi:tyrosyl-tRNA synthetase